jgi:hypothetical protein
MGTKGHKNGGKIGGRHTTVSEHAIKVVDFAEKLPEVTRISIGRLTAGIKNAPHCIKLVERSGGLLVKVRGSNTIQEFTIYSNDVKKTIDEIEGCFGKK